MSDSMNKFQRFLEEHARLHDPEVLRSAVELVPIELTELVDTVSPTRKKKGASSAWQRVRSRYELEQKTEAVESLLPADYLQKLRDRQRTQPEDPADQEGPPQGVPQLEIDPPTVMNTVNLFQELAFEAEAPAATSVELAWARTDVDDPSTTNEQTTVRPGRRALQRVVMDHVEGDQFHTRIGIPDGTYLFGIVVDGQMRPDSQFSQPLRVQADGIFTQHTLSRCKRNLTLTNQSKFAERVRLESSEPWLRVDQATIDVPPESEIEITIKFDLNRMQPGSNEARLYLLVERNGESSAAGVVHVSVQVDVSGAVPEIVFSPRELGAIRQGLDEAVLRVQITARGNGPLVGMITLPHSNELADFSLDANRSETSNFSHTFRIDSHTLPHPQPNHVEAALGVMLVTDSFLANYRVCQIKIPYRLSYLKKSMPALNFGKVRSGGTKSLRLDVTRSDSERIDLAVDVPVSCASYLQAYPAPPAGYVFRLDAGVLLPGKEISETIELIDRNSGLRDHVKVLATVTERSAELTATRVGFNRF